MSDLDTPLQRHKVCPNCGSKRYRFAKTQSPMQDEGVLSNYKMKDRPCKECGTQYAIFMPNFIPWVIIFLGSIFLSFAILAQASATSTNIKGRILFAALGLGMIGLGIKLLFKKQNA